MPSRRARSFPVYDRERTDDECSFRPTRRPRSRSRQLLDASFEPGRPACVSVADLLEEGSATLCDTGLACGGGDKITDKLLPLG